MIDCGEVMRDAWRQWRDARRRGWGAPGWDQWTFARCLRLAWMRANLERAGGGSTATFYAPGEKLRLPEWALTSWRQIIEDTDLTPERRAICMQASSARVINLGALVYKGAEPQYDGRVRQAPRSVESGRRPFVSH